jgi:hypothetical protein
LVRPRIAEDLHNWRWAIEHEAGIAGKGEVEKVMVLNVFF